MFIDFLLLHRVQVVYSVSHSMSMSKCFSPKERHKLEPSRFDRHMNQLWCKNHACLPFKGPRKPFVRPWQKEVPPLASSVDLVVPYPCDDDDHGLVYISYRGPSVKVSQKWMKFMLAKKLNCSLFCWNTKANITCRTPFWPVVFFPWGCKNFLVNVNKLVVFSGCETVVANAFA